MKIDLSEWNECSFDDLIQIPMPIDMPVETMCITTTVSIKSIPIDGLPASLIPDPETVEMRLFWREKK